jgi:4-amino-4-deoxychorismate lyase
MARMEWSGNNVAEGVLLDEEDRVIECTMSNLFARFDKILMTPDLSRCGVAGITRTRILEVAPKLEMGVEICELPLGKLMQADEILICNSLYGVWQVTEFNHQRWQPQALATQLRQILQE